MEYSYLILVSCIFISVSAQSISYLTVPEDQSLNDRVASEIRAAMGRYGLKQKDLATALNVSQAQVSSRLRGTMPFSLNDIEVISKWFSTTPQVLMGFELEPRPKRPIKCAHRGSNPGLAD